jgi:hypothetical protein
LNFGVCALANEPRNLCLSVFFLSQKTIYGRSLAWLGWEAAR